MFQSLPGLAEYVQAEFTMSEQHSYRLLDQAKVIHGLEEASGTHQLVSTELNEYQARRLKPVLPDVVAEVRDAVNNGQVTGTKVARRFI